jgi:hypothetical protein
MRKLMIAAVAVAVAGLVAASAPSANAAEIKGPCETVAELFETANIQVEPLPGPAGYVVGTAYQTVCSVTG